MAVINIKTTGFKELQDRIKKAAEKVPKETDAEIELSTGKMREGAIRDAPADQGIIRAEIQQSKISFLNHGMFSNALYSGYMEFGTKAKYKPIPGFESVAAEIKGGASGKFFDLLKAIVLWVARKGISGTYSVKSKRRTGSKINQLAEDYAAAWPIALSIARNGVTPHPFFFKQLEIEKPVLLKNLENILQDI